MNSPQGVTKAPATFGLTGLCEMINQKVTRGGLNPTPTRQELISAN